ncbi:DUF6233 domain-containing protein [Streptomyces sp. NPDC054797]
MAGAVRGLKPCPSCRPVRSASAADAGHLPARRTRPGGEGPCHGRGTRGPRRQQASSEGAARVAGRARHRKRPAPARVHTGDCRDTGNPCAPADPEQIRQLMTEGACPHCRPDTALAKLGVEWAR